jgi:hypothetical protein
MAFTPTSTAGSSVTILSDDLSNNATGSDQTAENTINIAVTDGPWVSLPQYEQVPMFTNLVFSSANSNAITVNDTGAGSNDIQVTLTGTDGSVALGTTSGLVFSFSDSYGTGDNGSDNGYTSITFRGTVAQINTALAGLVYTPTTPGYGSIEVSVNDLSNNAEGWPLTSDNFVNIDVIPAATTTALTDNGPTPSTFGQALSFTVNTTNVPNGETVSLEDTDNSWAVVGSVTISGGAGSTTISGSSESSVLWS